MNVSRARWTPLLVLLLAPAAAHADPLADGLSAYAVDARAIVTALEGGATPASQADALPPIEDASTRAVCYQMKDLLVHPLTALRLLREEAPDAAAVRHEVVEVVAHSQALAALAGVTPPRD